MLFLDALHKITNRQFSTINKLYSSADQPERAKAFAEKRDRTGKAGRTAQIILLAEQFKREQNFRRRIQS